MARQSWPLLDEHPHIVDASEQWSDMVPELDLRQACTSARTIGTLTLPKVRAKACDPDHFSIQLGKQASNLHPMTGDLALSTRAVNVNTLGRRWKLEYRSKLLELSSDGGEKPSGKNRQG